jgi:CRP/FNR family cyclic AMP-dependent transcriptional regulator
MKERAHPGRIQEALARHQLTSIFPERLLPSMTLCSYEAGEPIWWQGERPGCLLLLVSGRIKVFTTSEAGNTLVLSFFEPVELIGDVEYIRGIPIMNTVTAVSPAELIRIPHGPIREYGEDHPPLLRFLLAIITEKFERKSSFLSFNLLHTVEERLAGYLLSVTADPSRQLQDCRIGVPSLREAANQIGTSYRHLNRVLHKFADNGYIRREKGSLQLLNRPALRELAGEDFE